MGDHQTKYDADGSDDDDDYDYDDDVDVGSAGLVSHQHQMRRILAWL